MLHSSTLRNTVAGRAYCADITCISYLEVELVYAWELVPMSPLHKRVDAYKVG